MAAGSGVESDLTDLAELEENNDGTPKASSSKTTIVMSSPRRLRSKSSKNVKSVGVCRDHPLEEVDAEAGLEVDRRAAPVRKTKRRAGSQKDDSECSAEGEDIEIPDAEEAEEGDEAEEDEEAEDDEEEITSNDEEVDQLVSSPSPTPPPLHGRRTPVKRRLRPRRMQTYTPPSDGDDEEEEVVEGNVTASEGGILEDADEVPASTTPRKLRSGRIVGEDDDEDIGEEEEEDAESVDMDAEGETEEESDEPMDDGKVILPALHVPEI